MLRTLLPYWSTFRVLCQINYSSGQQFLRQCTHHESTFVIRGPLECTSVLMQDGCDIRELPAIVKRTDSILLTEGDTGGGGTKDDSKEQEEILDEYEVKACEDGFNRCHRSNDVLSLLETIPETEVVPRVAVTALKKLLELETNRGYRNLSHVYNDNKNESFTFTRAAVVHRLVDTLCADGSIDLMLDALRALATRNELSDKNHIDHIINQLAIKASDGMMTFHQGCQTADLLWKLDGNCSRSDLFWVPLVDGTNSAGNDELALSASVLPFLKKSQATVLSAIERRAMDLWWGLTCCNIHKLLQGLVDAKYSDGRPRRLLSLISKWLDVHIHTLNEDQLSFILKQFLVLQHCDPPVTYATGKFLRAKSSRLKNVEVVALACELCSYYQLRIPNILEGAIQAVATRRPSDDKSLTLIQLHQILYALGKLSYHPPIDTAHQFWECVEKKLSVGAVQLPPLHFLQCLLACVLLGKFPINLLKRIFNQFFMDRINMDESSEIAGLHLQLLDTALSIECSSYHGPVALNDKKKVLYVWRDGRILKASKWIAEAVGNIIEPHLSISNGINLAHLPISYYNVDVLIHKPFKTGIIPGFGRLYINKGSTAILVHVRDHYCSYTDYDVDVHRGPKFERHLLGLQAMKVRHLHLMGFNVVQVDFEDCVRIRSKPKEFEDMLKQKLKESCT